MAVSAYRPLPYRGRVILYRATEVTPEFAHAGRKQGWDDLTPSMEVVDVTGNHDTLVLEPHVGVMTPVGPRPKPER